MKRLSFKSNKLWNSIKNFLYTSSLFWLCGIVWIAIANKWYGWYNKNGNAEFAKWIYSFLDENYLANIPLIIIFICFSIYLFFKIWRDNDCRLFRLFFPILGIFILYYDCQVDYANIIWEFDYRMLLTIFLSIILLIRLLKGIRKMFFLIKSLKNSKNQKINSFADEDIKLEKVSQNLRNYASTIAERLKKRNNSEHSCAVGITGKWGSGKTTFLNLLEEELKNDADIVKFNPWMCRTPEQVTHDFFTSLRHQLSPKYSKLSNPIKKYAKYINGLTFVYQNIWGINIPFLIKEKSLFEIKQELSTKFSSLPRPVIVIIDDIDRLERDEVFEVLRLIRNTADLKNTNYLVAYDKEYVTCVLEEKNIKDASSYLEKIFQVEVHLPKVEEYLIWDALYDEIKKHGLVSIANFTEQLFVRFTNEDKSLILRLLCNYRRVKRFASLFMLNADYLNKKYLGEIKLLELFWLELLQVYDKYTYDILCNDPNRLLYNEGLIFKIKPAIIDNINKYNGEKFWKEETTNILKKIFNDFANQDSRSICYTENYKKYFTFGVPQYKLSIKERNSLFKQNADIESIINGWIDNGKTFSSIIYQFSNIPINSLSDNQLPIYLNSILYCGIKIFQNSKTPKVEIKKVKNLLSKNLYNKYSKTEVACNIVSLWFEKKIDEGSDLVFLSYLLNNLYATKIYNQNGELYPIQNLIIDNLKIENYLSKIISIYIENQSEFTAIDIVKEGNELFEIFDNCSVRVENDTECNGFCEYKQVAFNIVTEYFAKKEIKPALKEYQEAYDKLFHQTPPEYFDDEDVYQWYYYEYENIDNKMVQHFGSSFEEKLENFKTKCFIDRS